VSHILLFPKPGTDVLMECLNGMRSRNSNTIALTERTAGHELRLSSKVASLFELLLLLSARQRCDNIWRQGMHRMMR
jgi:hypothetical protein